jgi:hypothetical protein
MLGQLREEVSHPERVKGSRQHKTEELGGCLDQDPRSNGSRKAGHKVG